MNNCCRAGIALSRNVAAVDDRVDCDFGKEMGRRIQGEVLVGPVLSELHRVDFALSSKEASSLSVLATVP